MRSVGGNDYIVHFAFYTIPWDKPFFFFFGKDIVYILVIVCRAKHRLASLYMRWHFKQEMLIISL